MGRYNVMPYEREHTARINEPERYEKIRRENDALEDGIDVLWGILASGDTEVQGLRFDALKWDEKEVVAWLEDHGYDPIEFIPASKPEATFRVVQAGEYSASTGTFSLTMGNIKDVVVAFREAKEHGVLPALKYTHAKGASAIGVGEITDMWFEDGWLMAKATVLDPDMRDSLKSGILTNVSLEGQTDSTAYGKKRYPLVLTAISILSPGEWPAVPGAKLTEIAAGQSSERVVIKLDKMTEEKAVIAEESTESVVEAPLEAPEDAESVDETPDVEMAEEAPEDDSEDSEETTLSDRLSTLEARVLTLEEQITEPSEDEPVEEEIPIEESEEVEGGISANLATVENKILAGKREAFREYYNKLEDDSAKQIVLETINVLADITAAPEILASEGAESSEQGDGNTEEDLPQADRQEKTVRDIMSRDNIGFVKATTIAVKEKPELFKEEE